MKKIEKNKKGIVKKEQEWNNSIFLEKELERKLFGLEMGMGIIPILKEMDKTLLRISK